MSFTMTDIHGGEYFRCGSQRKLKKFRKRRLHSTRQRHILAEGVHFRPVIDHFMITLNTLPSSIAILPATFK